MVPGSGAVDTIAVTWDKTEPMRIRALLTLSLITLTLLGGCAGTPTTTTTSAPATTAAKPAPKLDVIWVPSPPEVVAAMLDAAKVGSTDLVYDLGCGEGEILIAAAKRGARGVGVDLDPERIRNAKVNATKAGVADRLTFIEQDLFKTDVSKASVVTLYLLPELNERLKPKLLQELRPGTPIVSHDFGMGDWMPEQSIDVSLTRTHRVFLWRVPARR
jgi:SAM-dependent methyltransferase